MVITITVEDSVLEYKAIASSHSFEAIAEDLGKLERNYKRRVQMETEPNDF